METKRIFRFFSLAEYGEEQKFLEEMHQKGWKLKSYTVFRGYVFEKCIPENWIYQLDYRDEVEDLNAYIQLFQDCGWEYVMMFNSFYYFRRKENGEENNSEIFSDRETRREYCESIYKRSVFLTLFCAIIFSIIIVPKPELIHNECSLVFIIIVLLMRRSICFTGYVRSISIRINRLYENDMLI